MILWIQLVCFRFFETQFFVYRKYIYHYSLQYIICTIKTLFYMVILNHIDLINYYTHVNFCTTGLKIKIKHWWNMNVLININKRVANNFICGKLLLYLWLTKSISNFLSIPFGPLRIKVLFITMVSAYLKLESFFLFMVEHVLDN